LIPAGGRVSAGTNSEVTMAHVPVMHGIYTTSVHGVPKRVRIIGLHHLDLGPHGVRSESWIARTSDGQVVVVRSSDLRPASASRAHGDRHRSAA
jgi:hypothetical protein